VDAGGRARTLAAVKERAMAEPWDITDKMLAYLIERADQLADHADSPRAEAELERIVNLIEAYEAERWPSGKAAGGKG
jgi:hypothetical protein